MADIRLGREMSQTIESWTRKNLRTYLYPPECERFMYMLMRTEGKEETFTNKQLLDAYQGPPALVKSVLHSDAGPAFIGLNKYIGLFYMQSEFMQTLHSCRNIDFEGRTACAKHLETNVASCPADIKELACNLLYGRCLSIHMAYETRDELIRKVAESSLCQTTKNWFGKTFNCDEGMKTNTQAFRNFIMTASYSSDSLIEVFFRNNKGLKEERCTLAVPHLFDLTRTRSAALKRGLLHETLDKHFTFVDVRMSKVSGALQSLEKDGYFMDQDARKDGDKKMSTLHRWRHQVSAHCIICASLGAATHTICFRWH